MIAALDLHFKTILFELGDSDKTQGYLSFRGKRIALEEIGSIWYRRPTPIQAPADLPPLQQTFIEEVEEGAAASDLTSVVPPSLLAETDRLRAMAHLFQSYVTKICDVRVVIMGEYCFAVALYPLHAWEEMGRPGQASATWQLDQQGRQHIHVQHQGKTHTLVLTASASLQYHQTGLTFTRSL